MRSSVPHSQVQEIVGPFSPQFPDVKPTARNPQGQSANEGGRKSAEGTISEHKSVQVCCRTLSV